ncbi:glutamate racemase [Patiriisocius marinus]|uniref:Glutamate racemase n=1 Tax=Patiriisocius marinus TaxID=1397112 RepID=A0A5J4J111_9FLAO|nr:glutamate racemase [Patiriisocius marinus]GER60996.1 glutamate racemase [Patiriisocius marinus]
MNSKSPIGIFDSGVGGTSIWKEIHSLLPYENTIYLADSANAPYGNRTPQEIVDLSIKNTKYLIDKGCKLIVVACNTATTNAIAELREMFNIPIIGIEPAIKPAALSTTSKSIGILATKGTLSSALFNETSSLFTKNINLVEVIGEGLVTLIENGELESEELKQLLKSYITPIVEAKCDHLVLGCTHYPYLLPLLINILPKTITIIDSGAAVAKQTQNVLSKSNLLNTSKESPLCIFKTNTTTYTLSLLLSSYRRLKIEFEAF